IESVGNEGPCGRRATLSDGTPELVAPQRMSSPPCSPNQLSSPALNFNSPLPDDDARSMFDNASSRRSSWATGSFGSFSFVDAPKSSLLDWASPATSRESSRASSVFHSQRLPDSSGVTAFRSWTSVTTDAQLVHRVLSQYFSESFCALPFICKDQFMDDFL